METGNSKINVLDKKVSELIAAGEVIERPSSIVKELLENSIDAGATAIIVEIKAGGKTFIRISDNGCGISEADVTRAFLRHATSKVSNSGDLDNISTLGFRGEALASVCAVSKTELITKTKESEYGIKYTVNGSDGGEMETVGCPDGTIITVRDIFYNVPARLKFLKQDVTEGNYIKSIIEKISLSHPEISFKFIRDGKVVIHTPGNNDLFSIIYSVFGKEFANSLVKTEYSEGEIKTAGYISIPMESRVNRNMQYFFINGRYVRSLECSSALEEAYKNSIMTGKFPACVLNITMPYGEIDVNVHPAKTEVRFHDKNKIFNNVYFAAKSGIKAHGLLEAQKEIPIIQKPIRKFFNTENSEQLNLKNINAKPKENMQAIKYEKNNTEIKLPISREYVNNIKLSDPSPILKTDIKKSFMKKAENNWKEEKTVAQKVNPTTPEFVQKLKEQLSPYVSKEPDAEERQQIMVIGELFSLYILAQTEDLFIIIDKHAAHERLIYERIKKSGENLDRQLLLTPFTVSFSCEEYDFVLNSRDIFIKLGFLIEDFGNNSIIVREIPSMLQNEDCADIVKEIADNIKNSKHDAIPEKLDRIYETIACKAAIKANDKSDISELKNLAEDVYYDDNIRYCPHGRPVMTITRKEKIERRFGR